MIKRARVIKSILHIDLWIRCGPITRRKSINRGELHASRLFLRI
jgi:hypothetical protein